MSVVFPPPLGPATATNSPSAECEAHVLEHELPRLIAEGDADELGR